jgi:hypothetical protein
MDDTFSEVRMGPMLPLIKWDFWSCIVYTSRAMMRMRVWTGVMLGKILWTGPSRQMSPQLTTTPAPTISYGKSSYNSIYCPGFCDRRCGICEEGVRKRMGIKKTEGEGKRKNGKGRWEWGRGKKGRGKCRREK